LALFQAAVHYLASEAQIPLSEKGAPIEVNTIPILESVADFDSHRRVADKLGKKCPSKIRLKFANDLIAMSLE
jgi:hypothetical protein